MAREEKPYRVYRGGRVRGGVPLKTKPAPREGTDGAAAHLSNPLMHRQ